MSIAGVTRELLVRYLDTWTPGALSSARRATFVQASDAPADAAAAEAALRVFGEFADRLRGRRLAMVLVAPRAAELVGPLAAVQAELGTPPELGVHTVDGPGSERLPAALSAAGAAGAPLLVHLDVAAAVPDALPVGAAAGRPAELLVIGPAQSWTRCRTALREAGLPLTAGVELVDRGPAAGARLVAFGTPSLRSLEAFKDAMWAVDEYAGVQYRDPGDPDGHLLDISLRPHPGPLRRELLAHLAAAGPASVTDLRRFTLTETVYRAADTAKVLSALLTAGAVTRTPPGGRLAGDVVISAAPRGG